MVELERKVAQLFMDGIMDATYKEPEDYQIWARQYSKQILALIKEAGYIQPEFLKDLLKDMQARWMEQIKESGWKSPEEVKQIENKAFKDGCALNYDQDE